jgi:pimeloyl-ACP methyl ester carboxylesterase
MKHLGVNGYDMAYLDLGAGPPLVCIHGSVGDFRSWGPVLGPLSAKRRVITPSLRHFFPERWDGTGGAFTMDQHIADAIGFIEGLKLGPVDLVGHSRGGHIAFRVAQKRPDLLRRVVLAEPGGELDASLQPADQAPPAQSMRERTVIAADRIKSGNIEAGLEGFIDGIDGPGAWARKYAVERQRIRDNAFTLVGQINEQRRLFSRADAEAIRIPTLFICGAKTKGSLPIVLRALAAHVAGSKTVLLDTTHSMMDQDPPAFAKAVLAFLDDD